MVPRGSCRPLKRGRNHHQSNPGIHRVPGTGRGGAFAVSRTNSQMTYASPATESAAGEDRRTCSAANERCPLISIVVPVYNEEDNVRSLYDAVNAVMAQVADRYRWEFIFTDNHSEDRTFECLTEIAKDDDRVCVYRFSRNFGFQRSIYTGFMMAHVDA